MTFKNKLTETEIDGKRLWAVESPGGVKYVTPSKEEAEFAAMLDEYKLDTYRIFQQLRGQGVMTEEEVKDIEDSIKKWVEPNIESIDSEAKMNIVELIKLADFLDNKGEHEAANEIDELIKSAGEEDLWDDLEEDTGELNEKSEPEINPKEKEGFRALIEKSKMLKGSLKKEDYENLMASLYDMYFKKFGEEAGVEMDADVGDLDEPTTGDWNSQMHSNYKKMLDDNFLKVLTALKSLKEVVSAEEMSSMLSSMKSEMDDVAGIMEPQNAEDDIPDTPEVNESIRQQQGRDIDRRVEEEKQLMSLFRTDIMGLIRKAKKSLSEEDFAELTSQIEEVIMRLSREGEGIIASDTLNVAFNKLADLADTLDESGMTKGADLIDKFLNKYSGEGFPKFEEDPDEFLYEYKYDEEKPEDEEELDELEGEELEKTQQDWEAAKKEFEWKESAAKHPLSKRADPVRDTQEEDSNSEQSKRYDSKHHHNLQIREPKRDQEKVDREGRDEHHVSTYQPHGSSLSTRHCPIHIGDMLGRVGEGVYQCPRDGAIFNFEVGYTTDDGTDVPGGSVAAQTPDSSEYEIPNRIFDSRSKVLNVIN